jgi:CBS domain-containing membrane protein
MGRGDQPGTVGEIMSHPVQVARTDQHAMDLVPLFSHGGHHHIPIVDAGERLVGVITQTDLVRTLAIVVQGRDGPAGQGGPSDSCVQTAAPTAAP